MIVFNEIIGSVFASLGYGTCGIGAPDLPLSTGEWPLIIDNNEDATAVGAQLPVTAALYSTIIITFPTKAQRDAVREAIFRFEQDDAGQWRERA